ncbi:hypothetical protein QYE76_047512 [Lolium multiflorum]|uniref:Uncharacterized protein n=1 Tax=Lolium multiflorum TaxID=4521 RepID=A0AAD8TNY3_LOLMU|nr:hypothetical protein QYE76_047512 [Lolium multiflorum]
MPLASHMRTPRASLATRHAVASSTPWTPLSRLSIAASPRSRQTSFRPRPVTVAAGDEDEPPPQTPPDTETIRQALCSSRLTVGLHWEAKLMGEVLILWFMEPNEPINTKFYQLGNGGSLIFEHDLNALSDFLGRPHPEFHGIQLDDQPGGELKWVITADLRGKMEPPTSERILFSFRESNWLNGLARALQEALARLCGQNVVRILTSRFTHLVRRDSMGVPMELQPHPELRHHAEYLDFMLYQTQNLDASRVYANQTHAHITEQGEVIRLLARDRKTLRQQCANKDATIVRLRAKIASLEATFKAQEDQLREMEEDDGGIDLQGGGAFLSDDDDFEEDEFTEEEDYESLEAGPDDFVPIDVEDEE